MSTSVTVQSLRPQHAAGSHKLQIRSLSKRYQIPVLQALDLSLTVGRVPLPSGPQWLWQDHLLKTLAGSPQGLKDCRRR